MSLHDLIILQNKCNELEQKLSDSEAELAKMRDIAEETQRKLDEAVEVIKFYGNENSYELYHYDGSTYIMDDNGKRARDFLAKIEGITPSK
jgi:CHASE3 domain sensor protein